MRKYVFIYKAIFSQGVNNGNVISKCREGCTRIFPKEVRLGRGILKCQAGNTESFIPIRIIIYGLVACVLVTVIKFATCLARTVVKRKNNDGSKGKVNMQYSKHGESLLVIQY